MTALIHRGGNHLVICDGDGDSFDHRLGREEVTVRRGEVKLEKPSTRNPQIKYKDSPKKLLSQGQKKILDFGGAKLYSNGT